MKTQVTLAQVFEFLNVAELSTDEWQELSNAFVQVRTKRMGAVKQEVVVGQVVEFYNKKLGVTIVGKIVNKGTKNAVVQTSNGLGAYRVPYTLLSSK